MVDPVVDIVAVPWVIQLGIPEDPQVDAALHGTGKAVGAGGVRAAGTPARLPAE
jgi:hypothetical protein